MTDNPSQHPTWEHDSIIHAYWVVPGRLLAGEYPSSTDSDKAPRKRKTLLDAGVNSFVDLTEAGEANLTGEPLEPYEGLLMAQAEARGLSVGHTRFEIPDTSIIDDGGYDDVLAHIKGELDSGKVVYVHCYGGKGRTGTVVGCWLIDNEGLDYEGTIRRLRELRRGSRKAREGVPDTPSQREVLRRRAQRREV